MRAASAEVLEAYDKLVTEKSAAEEKLADNKAQVTALLQEQKALKVYRSVVGGDAARGQVPPAAPWSV